MDFMGQLERLEVDICGGQGVHEPILHRFYPLWDLTSHFVNWPLAVPAIELRREVDRLGTLHPLLSVLLGREVEPLGWEFHGNHIFTLHERVDLLNKLGSLSLATPERLASVPARFGQFSSLKLHWPRQGVLDLDAQTVTEPLPLTEDVPPLRSKTAEVVADVDVSKHHRHTL